MLEIERKFLTDRDSVRSLITDEWGLSRGFLSSYIEQIYIADQPEIRLRKVMNPDCVRYYLTIKIGDGLVREEIEQGIFFEKDEWVYLLQQGLPYVCKQRYSKLTAEGYRLEINHVTHPRDFYVAEVEFPDEVSARSFEPYAWMGREVTDDTTYKLRNVCKQTHV